MLERLYERARVASWSSSAELETSVAVRHNFFPDNIDSMEVRQSVLSEIAIRSANGVTGVDFDALVRRLLLFDRVVIRSAGLREVPFLARSFGKEGLVRLQESGLLQISCEFVMAIVDLARNGVRELPLGQFTFGMGELAEREKVLRRGLAGLQGVPGLKNADRVALEDSVLNNLIRPPSGYKEQLQLQIEADMRGNTPALRAGIETQLKLKIGPSAPNFKIDVVEVAPRVFRIDTNLSELLGIDAKGVHDLLQPSVSAVANLNHRIADMAAYSAITEFAESEASLLFGKFAGIISPQNPGPVEKQFARVIALADFPTLSPGTRIDVDALLEARDSTEWRDFRNWLTSIDKASDDEIRNVISSARSKVGSILSSGPGRTVRFGVTSVLGLIPGANVTLGIGASAIDTFLVDRLFPTSGVCAFLNQTYPSLFKTS